MNSALIQSFVERDKATKEKNEAILEALEFSINSKREQIEWNNKTIQGLKFKAERNIKAEMFIWAGIVISALCVLVGGSKLIWNWGL